MNEFKQILLGNMSGWEFLAYMFLAVITAIAMTLFRVKKRDVQSERTPEHFSWSFFWSDNIKQQLGTIILIFLSIRVLQYWVKSLWTVPSAIAIGLISDQLAMLFLKIKDKVTLLILKKISTVDQKVDNVKDQMKTVDTKVETVTEKVDTVKEQIETLQSAVEDIKKSDTEPPKTD